VVVLSDLSISILILEHSHNGIGRISVSVPFVSSLTQYALLSSQPINICMVISFRLPCTQEAFRFFTRRSAIYISLV
jgi:hypothetical protein